MIHLIHNSFAEDSSGQKNVIDASFIGQTQCRDFVTDQYPENYLLKCSYTTTSSTGHLLIEQWAEGYLLAHMQQEAPNVQQEKTQKDWCFGDYIV